MAKSSTVLSVSEKKGGAAWKGCPGEPHDFSKVEHQDGRGMSQVIKADEWQSRLAQENLYSLLGGYLHIHAHSPAQPRWLLV
jgi:hypothetical protein